MLIQKLDSCSRLFYKRAVLKPSEITNQEKCNMEKYENSEK